MHRISRFPRREAEWWQKREFDERAVWHVQRMNVCSKWMKLFVNLLRQMYRSNPVCRDILNRKSVYLANKTPKRCRRRPAHEEKYLALSVVELFALHVLSNNLNIVGKLGAQAASNILVSALGRMKAKRNTMQWSSPNIFCPSWSFYAHVFQCLPNSFKNHSLYQIGQMLPLMRWSKYVLVYSIPHNEHGDSSLYELWKSSCICEDLFQSA